MTEVPIVTAAANEIKDVLGGHLGATLVESADPLWTPDPRPRADEVDFRRALARLVPVFMPDLLFRLGRDGQPVFKEFAAAIVPTEFMPGKTFGSGTMQPIDYCVDARRGADCAAREPRSRHHPAAGARQHVPLPHLAVPDAPQRRLARKGFRAKRSTIGPRSMRARNSGATISARRSRTGRKSPIRAIRSAGARASTSASCCANCCAAST